MEQCVINPEKGKKEPSLPAAGILAVNPSDSAAFIAISKEYGLKRGFLFHSQLYYSDQFFLAGPAVGAPMAVMTLEKLIALGAQKIIVYGWCGSLQPSLTVGDVFVPDSGISEEGTSSHYLPDNEFKPNRESNIRLQDVLKRHGFEPKTGPVWTTDAVYRETREKVQRYAEQGVCAVEMEYTALQAVARFRKVDLVAAMLVSDEVYKTQWKAHFGGKEFRAASTTMLRALCKEVEKNGLIG